MMSKRFSCYPLFLAGIMLLVLSCNKKNLTIKLEIISSAPQIIYAAEKIRELQQTNGVIFSDSIADLYIHAEIDSVSLKSEAYRIVSKNSLVEITGGDAVGLMYGLWPHAKQSSFIGCPCRQAAVAEALLPLKLRG